MKIILVEEDIKALVKKQYPSVTDMKFNCKDLEITLTMSLMDLTPTQYSTPIVSKPKTLDELNEDALSKGAMTSGRGSDRPLVRVG